MKFGKEITSQMVPEWIEAYIEYNSLKAILKEIHNLRQINKPQQSGIPPGLKRRLTLYRAFSGLTRRTNSPRSPIKQDIENQAILVNSIKRPDGEEGYETMFLLATEDGGENELLFFNRLDIEFNKVVKFYKTKVEEVMKEAIVLNKQMDALIAFRMKVDKPKEWFDSTAEMNRLASDVAASTAALSASTPSGIRGSRTAFQLDVIQENRSNIRVQSYKSSDDDHKDKNPLDQRVQELRPKIITANRPAPLEILTHVTVKYTAETPYSTIKGFLNIPNPTELKFSMANLKKIEDQLKTAFIEFYHKLRVLKSYSFLNILAISKIMKKYDKITSRCASKSYMKMVDNSYLGSSDKVTKLMERVEIEFIKHFSNSNHRKGMNILRPKVKKEKHRITFFLGVFAGCIVALILTLVLLIHNRDLLNKAGQTQYMETMFPLYSLFGFIVIHMLMYAANIYFWRRYRVNYPFIFGFKEGSELGYREVLLLCFGFAALALASVIGNLDMEMDPKTGDYKALTELLPLGIAVLVFLTLICPFNIIYRSNRFFLLSCVLHCICAPLYKVLLPDFFLADQLTSQVQAFRSLEFYICYYGRGDYKLRENSCKNNDIYNSFYFIIAGIPYWLRLLQCLRRLFEEKDGMQGWNALKYLSTIIAVTTRTAYTRNKGVEWRIIAWIASGIAAIFGTYWDIVMDWGLLRRNSKNRWLRDKLLIPHKSAYFGAMVLNVLLRFAWLQTVLDFKVPNLHRQTLIAIVASLEIIRRGIWNFFRLENEHLNNVGKYRAFKSVPLPFNYDDEDGDKAE